MLRKLIFLIVYLLRIFQSNGLDISKTNKPLTDSSNQMIYSSKYHKINTVEFEVENEIITLNLTPLDHNVYSSNSTVLTVESDKNGHIFKSVNRKSTSLSGKFYQDYKRKSIVYKSENNYFDGVFGEGRKKKTINSLLGKLNNRNTDEVSVNTRARKISSIDSLNTKEDFVNFQQMDKRLETLYPKLLLIVEWNYFKMLGENVFDAVKYLSIFWNAVNLKFKEISIPKINIVISGIVISKDDDALDFIKNSRSKEDSNKLEYLKLLSLGNQYFRSKFKKESDFQNYDSAILMTNLTAGKVKGSTIRGQICGRNILYVSDDADFGGILKATHELGHSLGLSHDERAQSPSSTSVMGPYVTSPNEYYWSPKSLDQIQAFSMTWQAKCLENPRRE